MSVPDLRNAAAQVHPLAALSVPDWATEPVTAMGNDHRRIEGLIAPGTFNVNPSGSAESILSTLINASAEMYVRSDLLDTATSLSLSPYDVLVVASLVQRESKPEDFPKVAQVIYNRLREHRTLEFDSTVNYPLDRREVATTDADRAQPTPWNTYVSEGCQPPRSVHRAWMRCARPSIRSPGLAVFRDHRFAGHHPVHPRLPAASGKHRAGQAQRCPRFRAVEKRQSSARRSRIRGPRSCTWPPTARWGCTTGPTSASNATPTSCPRGRRLRAGVGGLFGDDARQVRRAGLRRRAHRACRAGGFGQHAGAHTGWLARRQHRHRRCDGCAGRGERPRHGARVGWHRAAVVVALAELGVDGLTVVARNANKVARLVDLGNRLGVATRFCDLDSAALAAEAADAGVLVSTIPAEVAARYAEALAGVPVLLDVVYDPWPTRLAAAVAAAGGRVIGGLQMLLHQAFAQVEQFTGLPAPREAMAAALQ
ncbi:yceG-like family protein [Mycobacterium xenopi 4042]|uniref:YceG-like family protein n=1 Tax=Mycobacterium xenopi 4042 TaxID=1299334 RepID=X7ZHP6_MYCXE|nr:yceG-like family protein [Mycobacterium xenopi 4042]